jgi:uracil phosphoribosyltransferase
MKKTKEVIVIDHPLIQRDLTILRDKKTNPEIFRSVLHRISLCMAYESLRRLDVRSVPIETPLAKTKGISLKQEVVLVPILRAGLGMLQGFTDLLPESRVGHIGMFRNEETLQPVEYYCKLPENTSKAIVFILDPMLATGGSANLAITFLQKQNAHNIALVSVVAALEGIRAVQKVHPQVPIFTCAVDSKLNEHGYIVPGLGDAGDRIFGTK